MTKQQISICHICCSLNVRKPIFNQFSISILDFSGLGQSGDLQHNLAPQWKAFARRCWSWNHNWQPDSRPAEGHLSTITNIDIIMIIIVIITITNAMVILGRCLLLLPVCTPASPPTWSRTGRAMPPSLISSSLPRVCRYLCWCCQRGQQYP